MDGKVSLKASQSNWLDVSDMSGNTVKVSFLQNTPIERLKELILKQLGCEDEDQNYKYKLVHINDELRSLAEFSTARDEKLENGDNILLVKIPNQKTSVTRANQSFEAPSAALIQQVTENIPLQMNDKKIASTSNTDSSSSQVEQTLRKVLLALLELSYKFMHFDNPNNQTSDKSIDPVLVSQLMDMGFSEERAKKALIINNMDKELATEWLLSTHQSKNDDETPQQSASTSEPTHSYKSRARQFKPNPTHLENLLAMGFAEKESIQALRISGNNPNSACDWLLGDRTTQGDVDEPLSEDSDLYKALLANPTIHVGLHDPKVVEALEDMVENPWRRNNWAYESAVGNVILQILKLYNKFSMTSTPN